MEAKKPHNLLSRIWRTREIGGAIQSESEVLKARKPMLWVPIWVQWPKNQESMMLINDVFFLSWDTQLMLPSDILVLRLLDPDLEFYF